MGCLVRGGGEGEEGAGVDRTARIQAGRQFEWMGEWGRASRARVVAATEACGPCRPWFLSSGGALRARFLATPVSCTWGLSVQAEPSKKPNTFSPFRMRADLNNFWWTRERTWRIFKKKWGHFFCRKKFPNSQTEIFGCEFGFFFLPNKKKSPFFF